MKRCLLLLLVLHPLLSFSQKDDLIIPIVQANDLETIMVNKKGQVQFVLPSGHKPVTSMPPSGFVIEWNNKINLNAFQSGICPVQTSENTFYWVNKKGKIVRDFGSAYAKMAPFAEGYCLVWEEIKGKAAYWLIFLDEKGNNAFKDKRYWEASPFSEELAAVQLQDAMGEWGYIDATGELVIHLDKSMIGSVAELGSFRDGLAKVSMLGEKLAAYNYKYHYYFIDKNGKVVLDMGKMFPGKTITGVTDFSDGIASITMQNADKKEEEFLLINKSGKIIASYENVSGYIPFVNGLASLSFEFPTGGGSFKIDRKLIDKNGVEIKPVLDSANAILYAEAINNNFYWMKGISRKTNDFSSLVFSRSNHHLIYETPGEIVSLLNDFVLVKYTKSAELELVQLPGTTRWRTPVENKTFTSIEEALAVKDKVRTFEIFSEDQIPAEVFKLKNLETLRIAFCKVDSISKNVGHLQNLKKLELSDLPRIESLPKEILRLTKLEKISISDCENLKGLESIIEKLPSLKDVYLNNYSLAPGFRERMEKEKPSLQIRCVFSMMLEDNIILEE